MKTRKLTASFFALFLFFSGAAQLKLPIATALSPLRNDVQKVVAEFPGGFAGLRGEVAATNPQSTEYVSRLWVDKAESCTVTQYSSAGKAVYSWQAIMLSAEDFEAAAKKYKWLFGQLKGMNVKYVVDQYTLEGKYEAPDESLKFTTSMLTVASAPEPWHKLKIEIALQFEFPEWKVSLSVYEKEREDDERGEVVDR